MIGFDPGRAEGITGGRRVIELVEEAGVWFNAHAWSSAIVSAASLALSLTTPRVLVFELKAEESPMQHELVEQPDRAARAAGSRRSPGPGLGIEVREAVVETLPVLRPAAASGIDSWERFSAPSACVDSVQPDSPTVRAGTVTTTARTAGREAVAELDVDLGGAAGAPPVTSLTIAEIETIAIRVPLAQTYRGSATR